MVDVDDGIGSGDDESGHDRPGDERDDRTPAARLEDHLDEVTERPEEMQERLDDLGEGIDAARRQARDQGLLPDEDESSELPAVRRPG
jgi:hypothetical protein